MPEISDDIIIKGNILKGMFKAARHEAKLIEKNDMLGECKDLDDELQKAYVPFRDTLTKVIDQMESRLTAKLVP